jgi:hypothetical protein
VAGLDPPDPKLWRSRATWFQQAHDINVPPQAVEPGPRAGALLAEIEVAFCAGAWAAVVMLSWAIVEAEERAHPSDRPEADIDWLRERRNALIHADPRRQDEPLPDDAQLEAIAQGAVRVAFRSLFSGAWR